MKRRFICQKPDQGSILVVCLWAIMVLSVLGLGITGLVFQEIKFSQVYRRLVTAPPIAAAALKNIFYFAPKDLTPTYDTLDELSQETKVTLGPALGYDYFLVDKIGNQLVDESALINLNLASAEVLARLPGLNEELAQNIVRSSWRPFRVINEVLLVEGVSKDKFLLFKDYVTVYGLGKVNINTASLPVLLALGLDDEVAQVILRFRREHQVKLPPKSPSKGIFEEPTLQPSDPPKYGIADLSALLDDLREYVMLSLRQEQDLLVLLPVFTVKSEYLRLNVIANCANQKGVHYRIIIHPQTKKILSWSEY